MLLGMAVDWTAVLVYGVPSWLAAVLTPLVALIVAKNRATVTQMQRAVQTPSGEPIGKLTEETHQVTGTTNVLVRRANGEPDA